MGAIRRKGTSLGRVLILVPWAAVLLGTVHAAPPMANVDGFRTSIRPFLEKHCLGCHGGDAEPGRLTLHELTGDLLGRDDAETWHEVLNKLNAGRMPPEDEPQPPAEELLPVVDWVTTELAKAARKRAEGSGIVLRRLNRAEYRNTIRDLTGLNVGPWFDPTARFTTDTATDGFDNVGSGLLVSELHVQNYLLAARQVVDALVVDPEAPPRRIHWRIEPLYRHGAKYVPTSGDRAEREKHAAFKAAALERIRPEKAPESLSRFEGRVAKEEFRQGAKEAKDFVVWNMAADPPAPYVDLKDVVMRVSRGAGGCGTDTENAQRLIVRQFEHDPGHYRVRVRSESFRPDGWEGRSPQMEFFLHPERTRLGGATLATVPETHEFEVYREGWQTFRRDMQQRSWGIEIGFPYQRGDRKNPIPWGGHVAWVEIEGPLYESWPPASNRRVLLPAREGESTADRASRILRQFTSRAFRRPATEAEVASMVAMFERAQETGKTFEQAMKDPLVAVLASPHFLYLVEPSANDGGPRPLNDYELASRISYFLWSSMPDETLFELAAEGRLGNNETLTAQVRRMLADPRSRAFVENFTGQWLGLRNLPGIQPDSELFHEYDLLLQDAMVAETTEFFAEVLHENHSVLNLVDSDFTMLNERLALHYGIEGVTGNAMRRVPLDPDGVRGGLLTQAGILTLGSDGFRTLPVNRGVFVLEALRGDPPPPPPPNAGSLDDLVVPDADKLSTAERLDLHRRNVACAACHAKIDPWGMAFEGFDPIGRVRTHEMKWHRKKRRAIPTSPVTTTGQLADGRRISGPDDVKRYLLDDEDAFLDCLTGKLLTYALGRSPTFADAELITSLRDETKRNGYRLQYLLEAIVRSPAFRTK